MVRCVSTRRRLDSSQRRGDNGPVRLVALVTVAWAATAAAQSYDLGSFTKTVGAAPLNQTVPHQLGQVPKALLLWTDGKTGEAVSAGYQLAFGFSDGVTEFSVAGSSANAASPSNTTREVTNKLLSVPRPGEVLDSEAHLASWSAAD